MESIAIFSWGYWGWGNATRQLVAAVDAVEAARGFRPPVFVDVRFSRGVRAAGFRDHAFEQLVGPARYTWMRALGNRQIGVRTGPAMRIADPAAAVRLVDLAVEAAGDRRRLLFFCACEFPVSDQGLECHRVEVARLAREAAARRGVELAVVEWPGGEPATLDLAAPSAVFRAVRRGRASLVPGTSARPDRLAGLPWGTVVRLRDGEEDMAVVVGPGRFQSGEWYLPVLARFLGPEAGGPAPMDWASRFRERHGHSVGAGIPRASAGLFPSCVYTIVHLDKLEAAAAGDGGGTWTESKSWVTGRRLLEESRGAKQELPIVFADSTDCSRLLFWAVITSIQITADGTRFAFERLRGIPGTHSPQELVLLGSGRRIAPGYIRPYALCRTPSFLGP